MRHLDSTQHRYEPDELVLSKKEILAQFDIAIERLSKNRMGNIKFIAELKAVKAMVSWTSEQKFPYYWLEIMKIIDAVRSLNELRKGSMQNKKIGPLVALAEQQLQNAISTVPVSDLDAQHILAKIKAGMKYGGMKNA